MMNMVGSGIELCRNIVSFRVTSMDKHSFVQMILQFLHVVYEYIFSLGLFIFSKN